MTDQRPIDVSELRDGDIVRAKRGAHGVVEGVWHGCTGGWFITDGVDETFGSSYRGWTITDILRPVLVKGDEVCRGGTGRIGTVVEVLSTGSTPVGVLIPGFEETRWYRHSSLTRLPAAPEPDPECPFPMGARVSNGYSVNTVAGWGKRWTDEGWRWCVLYDPHDHDLLEGLTLAPEPAPITVGSWECPGCCVCRGGAHA